MQSARARTVFQKRGALAVFPSNDVSHTISPLHYACCCLLLLLLLLLAAAQHLQQS
jgi:hypothetical protein